MMLKTFNEALGYVREGTRSARDVKDDLWEGRCRVVRAGRRGKPLAVQYEDGRKFDLIDDRFYTPEAFVTLFTLIYAMSSDKVVQ